MVLEESILISIKYQTSFYTSFSTQINRKLTPLTLGFKLINILPIIFKVLLTDKKPFKNSFATSNKSKLK